MQPDPVTKYAAFPPVPMARRQWPDKTLTHAPIWCSVDLRDGNQALAQPMSVEEKIEFFEMLVRIGFKEIEVGFPSASQIEFDFTRRLIEEKRIPEGVAIQILCQCREDLITSSLESVRGAKNVIFHLYNSTSPRQREYVFNLPKDEIIQIPVRAVGQLRRESRPLVEAGVSRPAPGFAGELHEHRARILARDLRGGVRRVGPDAEEQDHPQPAGDGRVRDAQQPRRPERGEVHAADAARVDDRVAPTRTMTAARGSPRPSSRSWRGPTASRERSSATGSGPATSTSSRSP